jgi:hypothetical protein
VTDEQYAASEKCGRFRDAASTCWRLCFEAERRGDLDRARRCRRAAEKAEANHFYWGDVAFPDLRSDSRLFADE